MAKKLRKSLRMAPEVNVMLLKLAEQFGLTETAILELAVRKLYDDPTIVLAQPVDRMGNPPYGERPQYPVTQPD